MLSEIFFLFVFAEVVVSLDAPDEFLKTRVMNLPESVVAGTHNTEEGEIITAKKKSSVRVGYIVRLQFFCTVALIWG